MAGARPGHAAADRSHRPDQFLGSPSRLSPRQVSGVLRFRPVERVVQWPPHRQQLARLLPATRALWRGRLRDDTALPARDRLLPAKRRAARPRPLPRGILSGGVVHRSRLHRRLDIPPRPNPGCITTCAIHHKQKTDMKIELVKDGVRKAPAQLAKTAISPRAPFKSERA